MGKPMATIERRAFRPQQQNAATAPPQHAEWHGGPLIKLGWRMRLGVLLPSVNTVAEPQLQAMLPDGVSVHTTRLKLTGSSPEELLGMTKNVEEASRLLADIQPNRILFHCTATTTFDVAMPGRLRERITAATGLPATVTSEALIAAFEALGVRKLVLVTPYIHEINEREVGFLGHHGISVLREFGCNLPGGKEFARVEPAEWYRVVMEHRHDDADAYFISCAQVRSAEIIDVLEHDLQRPVVTSNQAAIWHCLRQSGITDKVFGFGTLLQM